MAWTFLEVQDSLLWQNGVISSTVTPTHFSDVADGPFRSSDAGGTNSISVVGAGVAAANLDALISTFTDASDVVVGTAASTTVAAANWAWGSNTVDTNGTTTVTLSFANKLSLNDLILVYVETQSTVSSLGPDSAGNTYTQIGTSAPGEDQQYGYFAVVTHGAAAGSTLKVTFAGSSAGNARLGFYHFSPTPGMKPKLDKSSFANGNSVTPASGSVTTTVNGELCLSAVATHNNVTGTTAGWTAPANIDMYGWTSEYFIQSTAGAINATYAQATGTWNAFIVTFMMVPAQNAIFYNVD